MINTDEFINFLKIKGYYNQFCFNLNEQKGITFQRLIQKYRVVSGVIDSALIWDQTPEGHDYWAHVNRQWKKAFKSGEFLTHGCKSIW